MYFEKFYEGAAIQDPDNPGNDLEQVEDDVLASHDEEVDDALYGFPGEEEDPVEEACMAIYEAEYNMNMIYKAVGMYELNEASKGKIGGKFEEFKTNFIDMVNKAIEVIRRLWERAKETFYKILSRINPISNIATNLYKTHTKKNKDFFKNGITVKIKEGGNGEILSLDRGISRGFDDAFMGMPSSQAEEKAKAKLEKISDDFKDGSNIEEYTTTPNIITASDLEKYVTADFAKLIREAYIAAEKSYKAVMKKLDECKKDSKDKQNSEQIDWICKTSQKVVSFNYMRFAALIKCAFKTKSVIVAGMNAYIKNEKGSKKDDTAADTDDTATNESFHFNFI